MTPDPAKVGELAVMLLAADSVEPGDRTDEAWIRGRFDQALGVFIAAESEGHMGDCPKAEKQGPVTCNQCVADEYRARAAFMHAAGYVLESDAKEEAAAIADGRKAHWAALGLETESQSAHFIAAAIRSSIHKKAE